MRSIWTRLTRVVASLVNKVTRLVWSALVDEVISWLMNQLTGIRPRQTKGALQVIWQIIVELTITIGAPRLRHCLALA